MSLASLVRGHGRPSRRRRRRDGGRDPRPGHAVGGHHRHDHRWRGQQRHRHRSPRRAGRQGCRRRTSTSTRAVSPATRSRSMCARTSRRRPAARRAPTTWCSTASSPWSSPSPVRAQTEVPTIVGAGIPYITVSGGSTAELTTPGAYDLEGGFPAYLGAMALSAKAARPQEGRLPRRERAGGHSGRAGVRCHGLQGGGRRLHGGPGQRGHRRHQPADAVGRLGWRGRGRHGRRRDVVHVLPAGLQHARPQAAPVRALDLSGPEHPRLAHARQGARRLLHHHLDGSRPRQTTRSTPSS